jgi:hypothetical protein
LSRSSSQRTTFLSILSTCTPTRTPSIASTNSILNTTQSGSLVYERYSWKRITIFKADTLLNLPKVRPNSLASDLFQCSQTGTGKNWWTIWNKASIRYEASIFYLDSSSNWLGLILECGMARQHLWKKRRWMGQASEMDSQQQAILPQCPLAHSGPATLWGIQSQWIDSNFWGHRYQWCFFTYSQMSMAHVRCIHRRFPTLIRGDEGSTEPSRTSHIPSTRCWFWHRWWRI